MEPTLTYHDLQIEMADVGYMASDDLAVSIYLALTLGRPLLLEGAAGVGKTEVARVLADVHDTELVRLQCYEGLDAAQAIYEWNYQKQLLSIRASAEEGTTGTGGGAYFFARLFAGTPAFGCDHQRQSAHPVDRRSRSRR